MSADRSSTERIRRRNAVLIATGILPKSIDYTTYNAKKFGKAPYYKQLGDGAIVVESCCSIQQEYVPSSITGIAYGNGLWVAGGYPNIIYTTDPMGEWKSSPGKSFCQSVAFGNNLWVAVGFNDDETGNDILYSTDPTVGWTKSPITLGNSNQAHAVYDVLYANGLWIAVGFNQAISNTEPISNILVSIDPTVGWSNSPGDPFCYNGPNFIDGGGIGIGFGNGIWVAVGRNGVNLGKNILYSSNPYVGWSESPGSPFGTAFGLISDYGNSVDYGNNIWVAVGYDTTNNENILYSTDPSIGWIASPGTPFGSNGYGSDITYANGLWVAVGQDGSNNGNNILYSTDPSIGWTVSPGTPFGSNGDGNSIAYANGLWVAVGQNGEFNGTILYSTDPTIGWTTSI